MLLHGAECVVVLIGGVGALDVGNRIVGAEASKRVDMAICMVACEIAMVEPQDALGMEIAQKALLYLVACEGGIAVGREETLGGGHECASSIAFDATSLKDKIEMRLVGAL